MKDLIQFWDRVSGKKYTAVSTTDRELRDISSKKVIDTSALEANLAECENLRYRSSEEDEEKSEPFINRLISGNRRNHTIKNKWKNSFTYLLLGFISLAVAFFILIAKPYDVLFKLKVVLTEGGEIYEMWRKPEVELYLRVYLFNVTNVDEYMSGQDKKLKLAEVGPYVYKESLEHKNVTFNNNETLSASPVHPLTWMENMSEGRREDDLLYLPNIALLSISNVVGKSSIFVQLGLNGLVSTLGQTPIVKMTAKEFMFGYESSLVTLGNSFIPSWIHFDKLGLIDRMYDFNGDYETIYTGADNVSIAGLIDTYRGSQNLPQWEGEHCSSVQYASDGTKFKGHLNFGDQLLFYRKSLCRAAPLISTDIGKKSGMKAFRYSFPENMLDNGKVDKRNQCFCKNGKCLPPGLIDVTDCYYGFPITLSYPHFYKGDSVLFDKVEGLEPTREKHESSFWIQPESGLPLEVNVKIQINMALENLSGVTQTAKFTDMHLPLLWFEFRMFNLPPKMEERFKMYLNVLPVVEQAAMCILFIIGALIIFTTAYRLAFVLMFRNNDNKCHKNIILTSADFNTKINGSVYAPCEIPLHEKSSDEEKLPSIPFDKRKFFIKSHSEKLIDISSRLNDKVNGTVGSVREMIRPHIKNIFNKNESVSNPHVNTGYKNDSDDGFTDVERKDENTNAGFDDAEFSIEILDDGAQFDSQLSTDRKNSGFVNSDLILNLDDE